MEHLDRIERTFNELREEMAELDQAIGKVTGYVLFHGRAEEMQHLVRRYREVYRGSHGLPPGAQPPGKGVQAPTPETVAGTRVPIAESKEPIQKLQASTPDSLTSLQEAWDPTSAPETQAPEAPIQAPEAPIQAPVATILGPLAPIVGHEAPTPGVETPAWGTQNLTSSGLLPTPETQCPKHGNLPPIKRTSGFVPTQNKHNEQENT